MLGRTLCGGYVVLELIGTGGMGRVYRAEQSALSRSVAIKVIHPHLVHDPGAASRFVNEAHAASRLNHPHVVSVIDFGRTDDGLPFIVMEHLRGPSLAQVMEDVGLLTMARVIAIVRQTLEALSEAHELGIVHRDLKPANIALERTRTGADFVKVLDFGLAQVISGGSSPNAAKRREVLGTPAYMSPEQAAGAEVDHRSDLYSLGVILYELATGRRLSQAETALAAVMERMLAAAPDETDIARGRPVPEPFVPIILKAVATDPKARYETATQFRQAIEEADRRVVGQCVRPTIPVPKGAVMCPACGAPVPDKDRFCGACGERVSASVPNPLMAPPLPPSAPPCSAVRPGRHTTRLQLRASGTKSQLHRLHELRLNTVQCTQAARIVGAPGVGKTTLLREFLVAARSTGDSCVELGPDPWWARPACAGLRTLVGSLAGVRAGAPESHSSRGASASAALGLQLVFDGASPRDLGLSPSKARLALCDALRWAIERGAAGALTGRLVVGVDDLDRVDGPTVNALLDVLANPPDANLLIVATQSLQAQIDWPRSVTEHLLPGWDEATATTVLGGFGGDLALPDATKSVLTPLYLEQLIRLHFEGGTAPSRETADIIARRIEALDLHARGVLHAMTTLGDQVNVDDLRAILPAGVNLDRGLFALAQGCVIERSGQALVWTHPLLREVALSIIPAATRRELRSKAGELLAQRNAALEVLAWHAREAEQWFDALFLIEQAAGRTASLGDTNGTAHWLWTGYETVRRAVASGGLDDAEQAMLSFGRKLGDALLDCGQLGEADTVLREVLEFVGPSSAGYVQILRGLARVQVAGTGSGDPLDHVEKVRPTPRPVRAGGVGNAS